MASSSSAKKVAKLAKQGKGKKVRFQGGTTFPLIVAAVCVLGLLLVTAAKLTGEGDGEGSPTLQDHWHHAFGMYVCDEYLPDLIGNAEERGTVNGLPNELLNRDFANTGIHSHDDGVIHYHPGSARATGNRARLGVFLDVYDIEVNDDGFEIPASQVAEGEQRVFNEKEVKANPLYSACADDDLVVKLFVWQNFANHGESQAYTVGLRDARMDKNGMIFVLALVPSDRKSIPVPGWACELPELGVSDGGAETAAAGDDCGTDATTTTSTADTTPTSGADTTPDTTPSTGGATTPDTTPVTTPGTSSDATTPATGG